MKDAGEDAMAAPQALFEVAVKRLDADAAGRLRTARRRSLAAAAPALHAAWRPALATALVLAAGLAWWLPRRGAEAPGVAAPATLPAANAPGLVEVGDEAEIYAWLAEAPVASEDPGKERKL